MGPELIFIGIPANTIEKLGERAELRCAFATGKLDMDWQSR